MGLPLTNSFQAKRRRYENRTAFSPRTGNVRFRSLKRLKSRDQVLTEITRWLQDFTELERLVGEKSEHGLKPLWKQIRRRPDIDTPEISAMVRSHFGLSDREPLHDICGLLESQGIKVNSVQVANDAFMGLSVAEEDGGPAVIVNTWDRLPVETWIYSAAHELGHLVLHEETSAGEAKTERQADRFAGAFLAPRESFLEECPRRWSFEAFRQLKFRWRISIAALCRLPELRRGGGWFPWPSALQGRS